jgi:hypothetical protein
LAAKVSHGLAAGVASSGDWCQGSWDGEILFLGIDHGNVGGIVLGDLSGIFLVIVLWTLIRNVIRIPGMLVGDGFRWRRCWRAEKVS